MSGYAYIARNYGLRFRPGMRVQLVGTKRVGTVCPDRHPHHYVKVRFDGERVISNCHPGTLDAPL